MVVVRGSVTQIEKAFHVGMRTYQHPAENRIFYSADREPSFALDVPVAHISGLNNYSYPHPGAGPRPSQPGVRHRAEGPAATGSGPGGTFLGSDMRAAYNMGSNTGAGQTVGLAEFSGYTASDISLYFSNIHQTNNVPINNIVVDGGSATNWTNANDEGETCLDIEQAVSVAPGLSQLLVYIGPTSFGTGVDGYIFSRMATDNLAKQLSNSWWWSPDDPATDDPYFEEMATQGQTFISLAGDYGAYTGDNADDMGYPAEETYVTVVGGTALTTSSAGGPWQSEVAWNNSGEGSGGGPADDGTTYFGIPNWQTPVINSSNGGSTTLRNSPDVAMQADFVNYICYEGGSCATNWGGTSFAAPRWAAFMALVNQQVVANGQTAGLGFINPTLYSIGQSSSYNSDFHDITSGNNDTSGQSHSYSAVVGYDLVTGWGSPNGQNLINALASATVNTVATFSPVSLFFGTQVLAKPTAARAVTLTNSGADPLVVSSIAVEGANSGDFGVDHNCPVFPNSLAAGGGCTLQVTFTPQAGGPRKSSISISDNAGSGAHMIILTGVGTEISTAPSSLTFNNQQVGTPSSSLPVVITNEGGTGVNLWQIAFVGANAGDFSQSNTGTCGNSLGAGANCMVNVIFTPAAAGSRTASLVISDDGGGSPQAVPVAGTGTSGAAARLSISTLVFGEQAVGTTSSAQRVVLSNRGSVPLAINSMTVAGATSRDFVQTNTCGSSLAAGASCTIEIRFTPRAIGTRTAVIHVLGNGQPGSPQVKLQGTGIGRGPRPILATD